MVKLTMTDKFKIQEGILDGIPVDELVMKLRKSEDAVQKFANQFNAKLESRAVKDVPEEAKEPVVKIEEEPKTGVKLRDEIILEVVHKLKLNNIKEDDAKAALNKVSSKLSSRIDDANQLTALCMQAMSVQNNMIREAVGGRDGVAVMTPSASQIIDEQKKHHVGHTRSKRECLFNPKTGEVT